MKMNVQPRAMKMNVQLRAMKMKDQVKIVTQVTKVQTPIKGEDQFDHSPRKLQKGESVII
jgi:hypothetical protein